MSYARIVKIATLLSLLCASACADPLEMHIDPNVPAPEDPCAGLVYETTPYHDGHNEPILPGGTVPAGGTAGHLLHLEAGKTIASVRVRIVPQVHKGTLPPYLPTLDVRQSTEIGDGPALYADDPSQARVDAGDASVAIDYDKPHDLAIEPGWLTEAGTSYFVGLGGETGPGALPVVICGTSITLE